jgi:hypothetical protein
MIVDESYFHLVNRRLTAARFQLSLAQDENTSITAAQKQSCIESALLQIYFALVNYLNELLSQHNQPCIENSVLDLGELLGDEHFRSYAIHDLDEIRILLDSKSSMLYYLTQLPSQLIALNNKDEAKLAHTKHAQVDKHQTDSVNLIAVSVEDEEMPLLSLSMAEKILQELQVLIDRQRESQIEY